MALERNGPAGFCSVWFIGEAILCKRFFALDTLRPTRSTAPSDPDADQTRTKHRKTLILGSTPPTRTPDPRNNLSNYAGHVASSLVRNRPKKTRILKGRPMHKTQQTQGFFGCGR